MRLRSGEIEQGRAETFVRHGAQIDLNAAFQDHAGLCGPFGEHAIGIGRRDKAFGDALRRFRRGDQVEIADRFLSPAKAAGDFSHLDGRFGAQAFEERLGMGPNARPGKAFIAFLLRLQFFAELLLAQVPKPGRARTFPARAAARTSSSVCGRGLRHWQRSIARRGPIPGTWLSASASAGTSGRSRSSRDKRPLATISAICAARSLPMPGRSSGSPPARDHVGDFFRRAAQGPRRIAVGANAERIVMLQIEQVRDLVEGPRDVLVGDFFERSRGLWRAGHFAIREWALRRRPAAGQAGNGR